MEVDGRRRETEEGELVAATVVVHDGLEFGGGGDVETVRGGDGGCGGGGGGGWTNGAVAAAAAGARGGHGGADGLGGVRGGERGVRLAFFLFRATARKAAGRRRGGARERAAAAAGEEGVFEFSRVADDAREEGEAEVTGIGGRDREWMGARVFVR